MRRRFAWYCLYAVLLPVLLLIVTVTMDLSPAVPSTYLKPNFGVVGCWFKSKKCYFYHKHVLYVDVILETSSEIPWFLLIKVGLDIFFILYTLSGQFSGHFYSQNFRKYCFVWHLVCYLLVFCVYLSLMVKKTRSY